MGYVRMWENTDCDISFYPCHRRSSVIDSGSIAEEEEEESPLSVVVVGKRSQQGLSKQQVARLQLSKTQMEARIMEVFCVLFERRDVPPPTGISQTAGKIIPFPVSNPVRLPSLNRKSEILSQKAWQKCTSCCVDSLLLAMQRNIPSHFHLPS